MFKHKINRLLNEFGIKQEALISLINSNRVTFAKNLKYNSFDKQEETLILSKYGSLLS